MELRKATLEEINKLKIFVEQVSVSPEPSKKAFEIVKVRYENGAANPITSLRALAKNSPQPVQRWLLSIADETWNVLLRSAHAHISSEWVDQVYHPYKTGLAGRYPLNRSAKQELEIFDFSGRKIYFDEYTGNTQTLKFNLDMLRMNSGIYFIGIKTTDSYSIQKLIVIRNK